MHGIYRFIFTTFCLSLLGAGLYFFYGLKENVFSQQIEDMSFAKGIVDEKVEIKTEWVSEFETRRFFILKKPNCELVWSVFIKGDIFSKFLILENNQLSQKCSLEASDKFEYELSLFKQIFKTFDPKQFSLMELNFQASLQVDENYYRQLVKVFGLHLNLQEQKSGRRIFQVSSR